MSVLKPDSKEVVARQPIIWFPVTSGTLRLLSSVILASCLATMHYIKQHNDSEE